jgi:hypothetical protein
MTRLGEAQNLDTVLEWLGEMGRTMYGDANDEGAHGSDDGRENPFKMLIDAMTSDIDPNEFAANPSGALEWLRT